MIGDRRHILVATCAAFLLPAALEAQARRCRVAEVVLSPPDAQVRVGETIPFLATAYDAAGNPCDNVTFAWAATNARAATVNRDGIATGVAVGVSIIEAATGTGAARRVGRATVSVSASGPSVTSQTQPGGVTVIDRPAGPGGAAFLRQPDGTGVAEALVMNPLRVQLVRGESRALEYYAVRGDGSAAARVPIIFTIEPGGERVATVDSFGTVTSLGDTGVAIVRAVVPGNARIQPKQIRVEVRGDELRFNRRTLSLSPGAVETLSVFIPAQERALNPVGLFQFVSSDGAIATVNPVQPILTAVAAGTATIRAQSSLYPDLVVTVNVHRPVAALRLEPGDSLITLAIGGTTTVRARALGADSSPVPEAPLRWTLPDSAIVAFDSATGAVRARRVGTAVITATAPFRGDTVISRSLRIRVVAGALAVDRPRLAMPHGTRAAVAVSLLDDRRQPIGPATQLTWTSSADSIAVMEGTTVVARRPGLARLTGRTPWDSTITIEVAVGGDLLVTAQRQGRFDLYQIWPGGVIPMTADSAIESYAAWSPDLTRIAYVRTPQGSVDGNLWVMNADGTNPRQLTRDSASLRFVSWVRPGGEHLVFESGRSGSSQIWVINADGTNPRQLTQGPLPSTMPFVSPDGRRIVYMGLEETSPQRRVPAIREIGIDGTGGRTLVHGLRVDQPQYTPDGQNVLFLRDEGTQRAPSKRVYRLRPGLPVDSAVAITPANTYVSTFSQSADGQTIAATILQVTGQTQTTRVMTFSIATGTFQALPGLENESLSSPSMRPAVPVAAPAGGTR